MKEEKNSAYPAGIKWTKQRKCVYEILEDSVEPLSAVQIYQKVLGSGAGEGYAISTVYRILGAFEEKGLVSREVWMEDGTAFYELNRGGHTHYAICLECHKKIPLSGCPFSHMHPEPDMHLDPGAEGFTVVGHRIELYGYCRECSRAKSRETECS